MPKFKTYKGAREYLVDEESLIFGARRRKKDDLIFNIYTFEVCYYSIFLISFEIKCFRCFIHLVFI